jgi:hypothetical protein
MPVITPNPYLERQTHLSPTHRDADMSFRKLLTLAAVGGTLAVAAPALPGNAAPSGGCPYPPNRPVLTLTASPSTIASGGSSVVFGKFKQNNCGIKNASVAVRQRALVNGKPSGSWHRLTTVTTNANGVWTSSVKPTHNEQVQAVFRAAGSLPSTFSSIVSVLVRDHLTIASTAMSNCRMLLSGQTSPVKANRRVFVQSRGPSGHFKGWTTMFESRTNAKGRYSVAVPLTCGSTNNLAVYIAHDGTNLAGRSRTLFGLKPHK